MIAGWVDMKNSFLEGYNSVNVHSGTPQDVYKRQLLVSASTDEEKTQFLEIVQSNNGMLQQLIADILDLSKLEAGTLEFVFSDVDINQMMSDLEPVSYTHLDVYKRQPL